MDRYSPVLREFLLLVFELWLKRIEEGLQLFAEALDDWLHDVFQHPNPDWRESFEQLLAEQEAEGRTLTPESHQDLLDYLEGWADSVESHTQMESPRTENDRSEHHLQPGAALRYA